MRVLQLLILFLLTLVFTSCSNSVYYTSETLPNTIIDKEKSLSVYVPDSATIEEKKMKIMLENILKQNGYNVNGSIPYYVLIFELSEEVYNSTKIQTDYVPTTSYSTTYINGNAIRTNTINQVPNTYSKTVLNRTKKNYLTIGDYKSTILWDGFMSAKQDEYDENTEAMMNGMLSLIGKDFKGFIEIESK